MNHKIFSMLFALAMGLGVAIYAYQRVSDPLPGIQRQQEERIVMLARDAVRMTILGDSATEDDLLVVDPLAPNRVAGKVYVYPTSAGWEVSGYYRRDPDDGWHPWLMRLDENGRMLKLSVRDSDPRLARRAATIGELSVEP